MRRISRCLCVLLCLSMFLVLLSGCSSVEILRWEGKDGQVIEMRLDLRDNWGCIAESPFTIYDSDENLVVVGEFLPLETAKQYVTEAAAFDGKGNTIIEYDDNAEQPYFFYTGGTDEAQEWDVIMYIRGTDAGLILSSRAGEDLMREVAFDRIKIRAIR